MKNIAIGSDHAGLYLQEKIITYLKELGYNPTLCVMQEGEDYTDVAKKVSAIVSQNNIFGVLICGSGVGVSIVANKTIGVRAALCHNIQTAELCRKHNNANIVCLGARICEEEAQINILKTFLKTDFEGGRHEIRVKKIE